MIRFYLQIRTGGLRLVGLSTLFRLVGLSTLLGQTFFLFFLVFMSPLLFLFESEASTFSMNPPHLKDGFIVNRLSSEGEVSCSQIPFIESQFFSSHFIYKSWSPELRLKVADRFINELDGSKIFLLESDVAYIKSLVGSFIESTINAEGRISCTSLEVAFDLLVTRLNERFSVIRDYLTSSEFGTIESMKNVQLVVLAENRGYPKDAREANAFMKKLLQFHVVNYMANYRARMDDARSWVLHSYELIKNSQNEIMRVENRSKLWAKYLRSFASGLDSRSGYLSVEEMEVSQRQLHKSYVGIGVVLKKKLGSSFVEVIKVFDGGEAMVSGKIKVKDYLIAIQREDGVWKRVVGRLIEVEEVSKLLSGPEGVPVRVRLARKIEGSLEEMIVSIARRRTNFKRGSISISYVEEEVHGEKRTIGLLKVFYFYEGKRMLRNLEKAFDEAREKNVSGIILDLSTNKGGLLQSGIVVAGAFIDRGNVAGRWSGRQFGIYRDLVGGGYYGPLIVLTSRVSASASELVAAALQDYKRAVIVGGDQTFGKGSIQDIVKVFDSSLKVSLGENYITSGLFFGPEGNTVQGYGLIPDISFPSPFSINSLERDSDNTIIPQKRNMGVRIASPDEVTGAGTLWRKVDERTLGQLSKQSQERVRGDIRFDKILERVEEKKKGGALVHLSDVIMHIEEPVPVDKENQSRMTEEEVEKAYLNRLDVQESIRIMMDYRDYIEKVDL